MTITLNGTTGISNDGGYTGDGILFADTTPSNTLVTTTGGNVGVGTAAPSNFGTAYRVVQASATDSGIIQATGTTNSVTNEISTTGVIGQVGTRTNHVLAFKTNDTERARIDTSGNFYFGSTSTTAPSLNFRPTSDGGYFTKNANTTGATTAYDFLINGTRVGAITTSGSNTSYATSSDYRLKEDVQPMTGALAKVAALKPVTYKWKVDGSDGEGFIAHELQEVVPGCVIGEKDAVDEDGSIKPQGIDTSFLVATLTAAIQELKAIVDAQGAEIAALKGAQ
jgi:hypothetical protein